MVIAAMSSNNIGVDRKNEIIRGVIVAEAGPFKSGRGMFDRDALRRVVELMRAQPEGVRSRYKHPVADDGLGTFLGRMRNPRIDGGKVRADLHIDPSSHVTPHGDLGAYILELAASDPNAFGASLALDAEPVPVLDSRGNYATTPAGEIMPPLWIPVSISAVDIVGEGDATHSLLGSVQGRCTELRLRVQRQLHRAKRQLQLAANKKRAELLMRARWRLRTLTTAN